MSGASEGIAEDSTRSDVVLSAQGITKVYVTGEVEVHALRGVDFDLHQGELVIFLGASGSGKSTLLNILGALDRATEGHVWFGDQDLSLGDDRALTKFRRDHVGFVFQFYNLIPSLTARENVLLVTEISRRPISAEEALALVGLEQRMDHFPAQLSGGEQQRVAIARAIAKQPEILLCDEPTGALDRQTGVIVLEAIRNINRELGTTTAVITHNIATGAMADRVITLADGQIETVQVNETPVDPSQIHW